MNQQPPFIETLLEAVQARQLANRMVAAEREQQRRIKPPKPQGHR
jgi:hypothetical protein